MCIENKLITYRKYQNRKARTQQHIKSRKNKNRKSHSIDLRRMRSHHEGNRIEVGDRIMKVIDV